MPVFSFAFSVASKKQTYDNNWNYDRYCCWHNIPKCNDCAATIVTEQLPIIRIGICRTLLPLPSDDRTALRPD